VADLRHRKRRDEKPLALLVASVAAAEALCHLNADEIELLRSPSRPIVLSRKRSTCNIAATVAPGNPYLGIILPYMPVHYLLMRALGDAPLVMTSGNRSDEPIAIDDADAISRLADIADLFLVHNRPIRVRCDDSVTRVVDGAETPLRRSRGYAPAPIELPVSCAQPMLAVGGQLKATFALGHGSHAFVSHHLGDLDYYAAYGAFVQDLALYEDLFAMAPRLLVHDLHPGYASTQYARNRAAKEHLQLRAVQHHHAHMASCMTEHGLTEPVIGVTFDGTGYGTDGAIWGGEFLVGDCRQFRRAAHLRYVAMPGGEQAIRHPWRLALAHLLDAGETDGLLQWRIGATSLRTARQMVERGFNSPRTSSAGRLFDAVAALAGLRDAVTYEGQAAIELEWLAANAAPEPAYPWDCTQSPPGPDGQSVVEIDSRPIIRAVAADVARQVSASKIARRFHTSMAELIVGVCQRLRKSTGLGVVVLSGGVFMNALLTGEACQGLRQAGFRVYRHQRVPCNDGGLSLGQLAVAAAIR
jgi:hydrogenase maturation protein HypF